MKHVHHKLLQIIGMLFIRYKFRHIEHNNNTTLCTHFSNLSLFDDNKMTQSQIFTAQTAQEHHLLSGIRISYLYTWYFVECGTMI